MPEFRAEGSLTLNNRFADKGMGAVMEGESGLVDCHLREAPDGTLKGLARSCGNRFAARVRS